MNVLQSSQGKTYLIATGVAVVIGVSWFFRQAPQTIASAGTGTSALEGQVIQVLAQPNTPELAALTEDVLHALGRRLTHGHPRLEVGLITADGVAITYSKTATRRSINEILSNLDSDRSSPRIDPSPSPAASVVQAFALYSERVRTSREPLIAYIITGGSSDPKVIGQIKAIAQALAKHKRATRSRLYVVGVAPKHRQGFSRAFLPIRDSVEFAGTTFAEWQALLPHSS